MGGGERHRERERERESRDNQDKHDDTINQSSSFLTKSRPVKNSRSDCL